MATVINIFYYDLMQNHGAEQKYSRGIPYSIDLTRSSAERNCIRSSKKIVQGSVNAANNSESVVVLRPL